MVPLPTYISLHYSRYTMQTGIQHRLNTPHNFSSTFQEMCVLREIDPSHVNISAIIIWPITKSIQNCIETTGLSILGSHQHLQLYPNNFTSLRLTIPHSRTSLKDCRKSTKYLHQLISTRATEKNKIMM
jgi:hypothetical protein